MQILITIPVFLLMITVLVAAHEYGHYLFARLCGMDIEEFSIGMGWRVWRWMRRGDTDFNFRALPVGGFVRIKGMVPLEDGSETQIERGFYSKSPAQRLLVLFAGPLFSILAGIVLLTGLYCSVGVPVMKPYLGSIKKDSPAAKAGLREGDLVQQVNGQPVSTWFQMHALISSQPGKTVTVSFLRAGKTTTISLVPYRSEQPEETIDAEGRPLGTLAYVGRIGVYGSDKFERLGFSQALVEAADAPVMMVKGLLNTVRRPKTFSETVGGPVSIMAATAYEVEKGAADVIGLAAALSISLGILNLLPFPPMDGGQMAVAFAEFFLPRGKRLSLGIQNWVTGIGLAFIGVLVTAALWVDISRFAAPVRAPKPPHSQGK